MTLSTCFSSSLSVSSLTLPPSAPSRSCQVFTWTAMVSKLKGSLLSCSCAPSASPSRPPPMWSGTTPSCPPRWSGGTMQSQAMGNGHLPLASCQSNSHSICLSDLVRLFLLVSVPPKALSPSHQPRLPGLLHWPSTRNAFMLMGMSYSLNITNTAVKSTTSRHLLLLLLIFIVSCCYCRPPSTHPHSAHLQ